MKTKNKTAGDFFAAVQWDKVDERKAELIYHEAIDVQRENWDSLNVLNDKAFQLLSLALPLLTVIVSYLVTQWDKLARAVQIEGIAALIPAVIGVAALMASIWPRGVHQAAGEPKAYFSTDYYAHEYLEILHGNIRNLHNNIESNKRVRSIRACYLKMGLVALAASPASALLAFILLSF